MALSKVLLVMGLLAAALATSSARPVAPVAAASSAAAAAPGLAALVRAPEACSYFECGTKTVQVVAKHTYPCWFEVAKGGRKSSNLNVCNPTPYDCVDDASCTGWKQCKCDVCETVELNEKEYCKQPA